MLRNPRFNHHDETAKRQTLRATSPPAERLLWRHLRGKACGFKFRRQYSIDKFIVDFYCPALHLAIEIDGTSHQTDAAIVYDAERQEIIESFGISFLRFTNDQIFHHITDVMETLLGRIAELKAMGETSDT